MNKKRFIALLLAFTLAGILLASPALAVQQQQLTPTPYYLPSQLFDTYSVDLPLCWVGYISSGMVPCGSPAGTTPQNIDTVWPTTIRIIEFSLQADTWLALEVNGVIDDAYPGTLGGGLHQLGGDGKWYPVDVWTTGYTINKGVKVPTSFDENWASKVEYNANWQPLPAGQYRIFAWGQVVYFDGAVYGYWPSKGTINIYTFDNVAPPPSEPPAQMVTPTLTLEAVKPPVSGDLSIEDRIAPFQAVQGGLLVSGRPVAVVVKPIWLGAAPSVPVDCQVTIDIDGSFSIQKTGAVGSDIEFILPASIFPEGVTADHVIKLHAEPVGAAVDDPISDNDLIELPFTTYASRPLRLLFMQIEPGDGSAIGVDDLNRFAGEAIRYVWQVYPVPRVVRIRGSYLTTPGSTTRISASVAVAKTLLLYNSTRCLRFLPDNTSRVITPCNNPKADMAVGVFPGHYYGDEIEGWLYGRGSKTWSKWMDWTAEGFGWVSGGRSEIDRAAMTSATNYINTAHEIGHHYDLEDEHDPGVGFGVKLDNAYIWENGKIIYLDQNYRTSNKIARYINFMGEAGVDIQYGNRTWVNDETWNHILNKIEQRGMAIAPVEVASLDYIPPLQEVPPTEVDGPALLVMGTLNAQGQATIQTIDRLSYYEAHADTVGEYRLEALDNLGNIVGLANFNTYPLDIDEQIPFLVTIPLEGTMGVFSAVTDVRLSRNGTAMASAFRSPSAPTASFATTPDLSADPITLSWTAQDADGGSLRSSVYYTANDGQTWQVVALDLSASQIEINAAALPGGNAQFRVVVSDGMNETIILTSPLTIPVRPPQVIVTLPWGATFPEGEPVIASAYGYDPEDGDLPETSLIWSDETGQQIGQGSLLKAYLALGAHTLVVTTIDSQGQQASVSVTVDVQGKSPLTGLWSPMLLLYLIGCLVGLLGLAVSGRGLWLAVTPAEGALAALQKEGNAWIPRYRAGQVAPNAIPQILERLQARDRQGILWALDPFIGQWLRWDGQAWQLTLPPKLGGASRLGCGLVLIIAGLLAITAMAVTLWWLST